MTRVPVPTDWSDRPASPPSRRLLRTLEGGRRAAVVAAFVLISLVALALTLWVAAVTEVAEPLGDTVARLEPPPSVPARMVTICDRTAGVRQGRVETR